MHFGILCMADAESHLEGSRSWARWSCLFCSNSIITIGRKTCWNLPRCWLCTYLERSYGHLLLCTILSVLSFFRTLKICFILFHCFFKLLLSITKFHKEVIWIHLMIHCEVQQLVHLTPQLYAILSIFRHHPQFRRLFWRWSSFRPS